MQIYIQKDPAELGQKAALFAKECLEKAIETHGSARLLMSTGASQFLLISALLALDIDWSKIEIFHLDEYIGIDETHKASFRKYLKERFVDHISPLAMHYVEENSIASLNAEVSKRPIDVGLIGIGENAHIAFNDPPADFDCEEPFIVVTLDEACKMQQVGEGWFATLDDVPKTAVTMTVKQILRCKTILSYVTDKRKALAIKNTLMQAETPMVPATALKSHEDWHLYLDTASASEVIV